MFPRPGLSLVLLGVFLAGCSGGPEKPDLYPLTGVVTLDGEPLANANLTFIPVAGRMTGGPVAIAVTDDAGRFEAQTAGEPGAAVGEYSVTVTASAGGGPVSVEVDSADYERMMSGEQPVESTSPVPAVYSNAAESKLTATVAAGDKNDVTLELVSE